ncbi:hypothetical protein PSENEW3_00001699 [Picochlorum sp. SENEW3]|nr:hypothetical protein PSENEW3_00001699 [Picochlorum sp. SENEW3]
MRLITFFVFAVCAFAPIRAEEAAEAVADQPERAFIMARRDLSDLKVKEGAPLTITVEVYNAGNREASDVSVSDSEWAEQLFRTEGEISGSFDSIPAGATKSFSYIITPKVPLNNFEHPELSISYTDGDKKIESKGPKEYLKVHSKEDMMKTNFLEVGGYVTLGMLRSEEQWIRAVVIFAGSLFVYIFLNVVRNVRAMLANKKRKSALKEFGFKEE